MKVRASAVAGVTCQCQECASPGNRFTIGTNPRPGYMLADLERDPRRKVLPQARNRLALHRVAEKCLAHEDGRSSRGVYNKAEYAEQRRHMLQEWADMIDAWVAGKSHTPTLLPPSMKVVTTAAPI